MFINGATLIKFINTFYFYPRKLLIVFIYFAFIRRFIANFAGVENGKLSNVLNIFIDFPLWECFSGSMTLKPFVSDKLSENGNF